MLAVGLVGTSTARADDCRVVTRANVAPCAVGASAAVRAEREGVAAASGRRTAAEPWFPSSPTLSLSAGQRVTGAAQATNYYASLSQELEIAGQRASRRRAADADVSARAHDVVATSRRVAASAYVAYFDALAASETAVVARRLESAGADIARVTRARADAGVASNLDAEVADAVHLRLAHGRVEAERVLRSSHATLATLLGRDALREQVTVLGTLDPLPAAEAAASAAKVGERPEVRALKEEERAHAARAEAFRRQRFPTITVQVFAQNDGFNERVIGGGIALPIPFPQPVGRTFAGEASEADALARQTSERANQTTRELSGELAQAVASYTSARAAAALYTDERLQRSEKLVGDIAREIESGRLAVRDAVLAQQQLVDVLRGRVEARRALSVASVELALAAGVVLEGGHP
jgi:outer membrane protein, heavy metal efflux system